MDYKSVLIFIIIGVCFIVEFKSTRKKLNGNYSNKGYLVFSIILSGMIYTIFIISYGLSIDEGLNEVTRNPQYYLMQIFRVLIIFKGIILIIFNMKNDIPN